MNVLLPQAAAGRIGLAGQAPQGPPPVLWLLHGLSDDHTAWIRRTSLERYAAPLGLAVVMPAAHRSFYTDMARGLPYETFVAQELPCLARSFFRLSDKRADNFICGLSMGGYGAFKLAFKHPQNYAAAASLSGALDIAAISRERGQERENEYKNIFGDLSRLAGSEHDLLALASRAAENKTDLPKLYACCGTEDFLYPANQTFLSHARELGLPLTCEEGPGAHDWACWDRAIQRVLAWLPLPAAAKE